LDINLRIYYSRFGVLVEPILPRVQFDYNHVYNSIANVIEDFKLHGWEMTANTKEFYTFQRV